VNFIIPFCSSILFRLDGWGKGDKFLVCLPNWTPKWGGINYSRLIIGIPIALITGNWWFALTYFLMGLIFGYGEHHPITQLLGRGITSFIYGFMFGLASLSLGNAIWCGFLFWILMYFSNVGLPKKEWWRETDYWYLDWSIVEISFGFLGTIFYLWR